jgi:hypothetical protein
MDAGVGLRQRRTAALALLAALLAGAAVGCSGGGSDDEDSAPEPLPSTTTDPDTGCDVVPIAVAEVLPGGVEAGTAPTLPPGVDTGYVGSGEGSGNPYLVPGARQVPGPDMTVTTLGPEPLTIAVAVVPNPDLGSPAALAPGATTVPAPPTTLPPEGTSTTAAPEGATTTSSTLMGLADAPGCVAVPGDP